MTPLLDSLLDSLRAAIGAAHVLTEGDLSAYETDWRQRSHGKSLAVLRPGTTEEVAAAVRLCADAGVPKQRRLTRRRCASIHD